MMKFNVATFIVILISVVNSSKVSKFEIDVYMRSEYKMIWNNKQILNRKNR